jgi:hypothetical protein
MPEVSQYRFAPAISARIVGALLVVLAFVLALATVGIALAGLSVVVLGAVAAVGVGAVFAVGYLLTRRIPVVRLEDGGYRVRLLRGAGVTAAAWTDVLEVATATPQGLPVVVLKLTEARTTTIPVTLLDVDREDFVRELQVRLRKGQGLRPLS